MHPNDTLDHSSGKLMIHAAANPSPSSLVGGVFPLSLWLPLPPSLSLFFKFLSLYKRWRERPDPHLAPKLLFNQERNICHSLAFPPLC